MCCRVCRPCRRSSCCCSASSVVVERAQIGVHRHLRVHHDVALGGQVHDEIRAQPAPVGAGHADLRDEVDVLGHVRGRHAVAQLHLAPRAADLRALERARRASRSGRAGARPPRSSTRTSAAPARASSAGRAPARDLVADALEVLAIGSSARLISSVRFPSSPAAVARSASRCAAASCSTCSETCRSASAEIAFICSASCSRLPADERDLLVGGGAQVGELPLVGLDRGAPPRNEDAARAPQRRRETRRETACVGMWAFLARS